jgi:hypothetical protein
VFVAPWGQVSARVRPKRAAKPCPLAQMAPKRAGGTKLSAAEQAANYQRRARELSLKAERKELDQLLGKHPHLVTALLQEAKNLGYTMQSDMLHGETPSLIRAATLAKQRDAKASSQLAIEDVNASGSEQAEDTVPTKYWTLSSLSVQLLSKKILASMEPVALSMANLRSMSLRGNGDHGKAELMKIIEFMTGLSADTPLTGELRKWSTLVAMVVEKNTGNARRARDMKLPPDWKEVGVFRLEVVDSGLTVHHNFTQQQVHLEAESLDGQAEDYVMEMNWSEARAWISNPKSQKQGAQPVTAHCLFRSDCGDASPMAKRARVDMHDLGGSQASHTDGDGELRSPPPELATKLGTPGAAASPSGMLGAGASASGVQKQAPSIAKLQLDEGLLVPPAPPMA